MSLLTVPTTYVPQSSYLSVAVSVIFTAVGSPWLPRV